MAGSKYVYNSIMNRWLNTQDYSSGDPKDWTSSVWQEGYDDPTYMTFKVEFGDWGASILDRHVINTGTTSFAAYTNDYDALPIGLLNCPYEGCEDTASYWQTGANEDATIFNNVNSYSAFRYLRSRNEDTRAEYLYYFVNGLFELQQKTPFIFKSIQGIDSLEKFDAKSGQRLKEPAKITLECYEGLNLKVRTLLELYRKAAWDDVYQRWILPENMREFKMIIYIFEQRTFQDVQLFSEFAGIKNAHVIGYSDLNAHIPVKAYECCPCEFSIADSQSWQGQYASAAADNGNAQTSKLVISVKNVKTYYKNGLLSDNLAKSYANQGQINYSISSKIDSLMIYDLVETVERQQDYYDQSNSDITDNITSSISNTTINGVRSLFLNKNIILSNEDASPSIKYYVRERLYDGPFANATINYDASSNTTTFSADNILNGIFDQLFYGPSEDLKQFRDLPNQQLNYIQGSALLDALSNYVMRVLSGVDEHICNKVNGAVDKILSDTNNHMYRLDEHSYYGNVHNLVNLPYYRHIYSDMKDTSITSDRTLNTSIADASIIYRTQNTSIKNPSLELSRDISTQALYKLDDKRDISTQALYKLGNPRDLIDQQYPEMNDPRIILNQTFPDMIDPRALPNQDFSNMENSRELPDQQFSDMLDSRALPDQDFSNMESPRSIPNQYAPEMESQRDLPDQQFSDMLDPRTLPDQDFSNMENLRELPDQKYSEMDDARALLDQNFSTMEDPRDLSPQQYAKLQLAREIPGMKFATFEDVRDIPEEQLVSLKDAAYRAMPQYEINRSDLLQIIKDATYDKNMNLITLDASIKNDENIALNTLRDNAALLSLSEKLNKSDDENVKIAKLAKMIALNTDDIKQKYITDIKEKKNDLISLTNQVVNKLPEMDMYTLDKNGDDKDSSNMAMISLTDLENINKNIQLISTNDQEYRQLSFGTLISLRDTMTRQINDTQQLIGLSSLAKDANNQKGTSKNTMINTSNRRLGKKMQMVSLVEENNKAAKKKASFVPVY